MDKKKNIQTWLDTAVADIRFKPDREKVAEELRGHLEDKVADLQRLYHLDREEAEEMALRQMGDAKEIGQEMARIHKPWLGYLWVASKVLLVMLVVMWLWRDLVTDHYYSTATGSRVWDWDDLPGDGSSYQNVYTWPSLHVKNHTTEELYTSQDDPEQLFACSYQGQQDVQVGNQKVSLRRAAMWRGSRGRELFVYFRVENWRFWERGYPYKYWFSATDSLGNQYDLDETHNSDSIYNRVESMENGPFFQGWQVFLSDVDPEAEWVQLDYGLAEAPAFSLMIELEVD